MELKAAEIRLFFFGKAQKFSAADCSLQIEKRSQKTSGAFVQNLASELLEQMTKNKSDSQGKLIIHKSYKLIRTDMSTNAKIKVIKKGAKITSAESANNNSAEKRTTQQSARDMVATVTNWVSEFQQRRRDETKQAIEKLFNQPTADAN